MARAVRREGAGTTRDGSSTAGTWRARPTDRGLARGVTAAVPPARHVLAPVARRVTHRRRGDRRRTHRNVTRRYRIAGKPPPGLVPDRPLSVRRRVRTCPAERSKTWPAATAGVAVAVAVGGGGCRSGGRSTQRKNDGRVGRGEKETPAPKQGGLHTRDKPRP